MSNYLLIHGNRHGKWAWEKVVAGLNELGHEAFAIDLPGHGDDPTPRNTLDLSSYRAAVVDFVETHDLRDLVLVGHSAGGATLASVAGELHDRLKKLVFVAALIPLKGESILDHIPEERHAVYEELARKSKDNSVPIGWEEARERYFKELPESEARALYAKLTPEPFNALTSKVQDNDLLELSIPMVYVLCLNDRSLQLDTCRKCSERIGAQMIELESGHDAMLAHADEIVKILVAA